MVDQIHEQVIILTHKEIYGKELKGKDNFKEN